VVDSTLTPSFPGSEGIDADLAPGQIVGEYRVESKLGQGGFGAVFKAAHPLIGKLVAIKVLSQRFSVDPQMVSRFVAEARAVNQIRHHNIIDIFSFGVLEDGRHYYVMEYLDGETLDHRIRNQGHLSLREALPILRALARALDAAHQKGIAHRDLKAENVFLASNPDGVFPKLLDFGIAKLLAPEDGLKHKTRTGAPMGTPHYMSPEQCHGRDVDHRTDIYAFGVLVYVMLTGVYPIDGDDYMTILMRQIHDDPRPASSHRSELPEGVDRAIAWLMRKDPAERPKALIEAVRLLEEVASGDSAPHARLATAETPSSLPELPAYVLDKRAAKPRQTGEQSGATALSDTQAAGAAPASGLSAGEPSRWLAPHRLLSAGAVVAAIAVVTVIAVRSAGREAVPAQAPAAIPVATAVPDAAVPDAAVAGAAVPGAAAAGAGPAGAAVAGAEARGPEAAAPAARPADVIVTIGGVPKGTKILRGGLVVATAPGPVHLPRSDAEVTLVLNAKGFVPESITVIPADNLTRNVTLKPSVTSVQPSSSARTGSGAKAGSAGSAPTTGSATKPGSDEPTNEILELPKQPNQPNQ